MNDDREAKIRELLPLVRTLANRVQRIVVSADFDDLIGDGSVGLIRAVDHFDAGRGTRLEPYARRLILGAMLNGLRRLDPVSERIRRTLRKAEARRFALAQTRGSVPTFAELEGTDSRVRRARTIAHRRTPLSLDVPLPDGRDGLADLSLEPSRIAVARAQRAALRQALALLPERQRRILALHYGDEEHSLRAIGLRLRVSPQRISQLHLTALARLRRVLPAP